LRCDDLGEREPLPDFDDEVPAVLRLVPPLPDNGKSETVSDALEGWIGDKNSPP